MDDDVRMGTEDIIETLRKKFERVAEVLDERGRRVWAARVLAGQQTAGRVGAASISKPLSLPAMARNDPRCSSHDGVSIG